MAERIELIDKNFLVNTDIDREQVTFYDVLQEPFRLYGVHMENDWFRRMPEKVAKSVSEGIFGSHTFTAGGRLRFVIYCYFSRDGTRMSFFAYAYCRNRRFRCVCPGRKAGYLCWKLNSTRKYDLRISGLEAVIP